MPELDQIQELLEVARRSDRTLLKAVSRAINKHGRDPLLWALVPLYLLRHTVCSYDSKLPGTGRRPTTPLPLNGADVARFWWRNGIMRTRHNITGALWRHIGYARHLARPRPFDGWVITPNGVRYVEKAVGRG